MFVYIFYIFSILNFNFLHTMTLNKDNNICNICNEYNKSNVCDVCNECNKSNDIYIDIDLNQEDDFYVEPKVKEDIDPLDFLADVTEILSDFSSEKSENSNDSAQLYEDWQNVLYHMNDGNTKENNFLIDKIIQDFLFLDNLEKFEYTYDDYLNN